MLIHAKDFFILKWRKICIHFFIVINLVILLSAQVLVIPSSASASDRKFISVSQTNEGLCAISQDNHLFCWPYVNAPDPNAIDNPPENLGTATSFAQGAWVNCVTSLENKLKCWGDENYPWWRVPENLGPAVSVQSRNDTICTTLVSKLVRCWSSDYHYVVDVPEEFSGLKKLALGDSSLCGLTTKSTVICWGTEFTLGGQQIVASPKGMNAIEAIYWVPGPTYHSELSQFCAVNRKGVATCWSESLRTDLGFDVALNNSQSVVTRGNELCSISNLNVLRCWIRNADDGSIDGELSVPEDLGTVKSAAITADQTCAVTTEGTLRCWNFNGDEGYGPLPQKYKFPEITQPTNIILNTLGTSVSISWNKLPTSYGVLYYTVSTDLGGPLCGTVDSGCTISGLTIGRKYHLTLTISNADGKKNFPIPQEVIPWDESIFSGSNCPSSPIDTSSWEGTTGEPKITGTPKPNSYISAKVGSWPRGWQTCSFWLRDGNFLTSSKNYRLKETDLRKSIALVTVGTSNSGSSLARISDQTDFSGICDNPSIFIQQDSISAKAGSESTISGKILGCPYGSLSSILARFRTLEGDWSPWGKYPVSDSMRFKVNRQYVINSLSEIKVDLRWKETLAKTTRVSVSPMTNKLEVGIMNLSTKGFHQGAILTLKYKSDRYFNGTCRVTATNNRAYNFALTYMGSEIQKVAFKVANGIGSSSLKMRWNGYVDLESTCESKKYSVTNYSKLIAIRSNF